MLLNRRAPNVNGVFVAQSSGGSMILNGEYAGFGADRTPLHELVHYLMQSGDAKAPLWLEEGLAEYFSNATFERGRITAGNPLPAHLDALHRRARMPLTQLFAVARESDAYNVPAGQAVFYAESWAAVDWLARSAAGDRADFFHFVHDVAHGVPVDAALRTHYRMSLRDLDTAMSAYASPAQSAWGAPARMTSAITIPVPPVDVTTTTVPLDRASTLYELGRFLAGIEEMSAEAERHFRAALDANPQHARALAGLGQLRAAAAKYEEAAQFFDRAVVADPADPEIALQHAEALMQNQIGALAQTDDVQPEDATRFRKARTLVENALTHRGEGDFPLGRALGDLGITYLAESDVTPGIAPLAEAHKSLPGRTDFALHLFAMYRRTRDLGHANPLFAELDAARKPQVAYAARAIIVRTELARANALTHEQRLDEAAAVIRELAASMPDPDARRDFASQADDLARVAGQNREIEAYNKAVEQVNAGKYREASRALNALLGTASDAQVIADTRDLLRRLAKQLRK
jgi:tetratricopeptide (TPR) repeat protein